MLVVADSSPVHYLVLIEQETLLPALFGEVVVPVQVAEELSHPSAPLVVRDFMVDPPPWLLIQTPHSIERLPRIDEGEEAAISLARELRADFLLIDDLDGRKEATRLGLSVVGTLGVLELAAKQDRIDLPVVIQELRQTSMRLSDEVVRPVLEADRLRRRQNPPLPR